MSSSSIVCARSPVAWEIANDLAHQGQAAFCFSQANRFSASARCALAIPEMRGASGTTRRLGKQPLRSGVIAGMVTVDAQAVKGPCQCARHRPRGDTASGYAPGGAEQPPDQP